MLINIFATLLIASGSFLEWYYYYLRYTTDGIHEIISFVIAVAMTLLLNLAVLLFSQKKYLTLLIIVPVALYSVATTSVGQTYQFNAEISFIQKQEISDTYILDQIERKKAQIESSKLKEDQLFAIAYPDGTSIEQQGQWRTTIAATAEAYLQQTENTTRLRAELKDLESQAISHETIASIETNSYDFYANLIDGDSRIIQIMFQSVLSLFIALMSPVGIIVFRQIPSKKITNRKITRDDVSDWVAIEFIGSVNGRTDKIITKNTFKNFKIKRGEGFDEKKYDKLLRAANETGVLDDQGRILITDKNRAINKICEYFSRADRTRREPNVNKPRGAK